MASYNNNNTNDGNSRTMSLLRSKLAANSNLANNLSSTAKGATLASIYQAKKSGKFEDTKVEVLKQQFQNQIERRTTTTSTSHEPTSKILNRYEIFFFLNSVEKMVNYFIIKCFTTILSKLQKLITKISFCNIF